MSLVFCQQQYILCGELSRHFTATSKQSIKLQIRLAKGKLGGPPAPVNLGATLLRTSLTLQPNCAYRSIMGNISHFSRFIAFLFDKCSHADNSACKTLPSPSSFLPLKQRRTNLPDNSPRRIISCSPLFANQSAAQAFLFSPHH